MRPDVIRFDRFTVRTTFSSSTETIEKTSEGAVQHIEEGLVKTLFNEEMEQIYATGKEHTRFTCQQKSLITDYVAYLEKHHSCSVVMMFDEYDSTTSFEHKSTLLDTDRDYNIFATYTISADWGIVSDTMFVQQPVDRGLKSLFAEIEHDIAWSKKQATTTNAPEGDIVFSPRACGLLVHEFIGHMLEEDNYLHSPFSLGYEIGLPSALSVFENVETEILLDDMGFEIPKKEKLIDQGRITSLLSEGNYRKGAIHRHPIPRMRDMLIAPGALQDDHAINDIRSGVYVYKIDSGEMNHLTGDFSVIISQSARIVDGRIEESLPRFAMFFSVEAFGRADIDFCVNLAYNKTLCGKEGSFVPVEIRSPACRIRNFRKVAHCG